jgi:hypothetical protein
MTIDVSSEFALQAQTDLEALRALLKCENIFHVRVCTRLASGLRSSQS